MASYLIIEQCSSNQDYLNIKNMIKYGQFIVLNNQIMCQCKFYN